MKSILDAAGIGEPLEIATDAARSVFTPDPVYLCSPLAFVRERLGFFPEPLQIPVFTSTSGRGILCCTRQFGKSTAIAALAVHRATCFPGSLIVVAAPTLRQSGELIRKIARFLQALPMGPRAGANSLALNLPNGSRVVAVPANGDTLRGFSSVSMLLIDEAARVDDTAFEAATPMLARSGGSIWLMSTPKGRAGFFHSIWSSNAAPGCDRWTRIHATASDCPRISAEFLEAERASKTSAEFDEEYNGVFLDSGDQLFSSGDLATAFSDSVPVLRPGTGSGPQTTRIHYYIGLDLGKLRDRTAIAVLEFRATAIGQHAENFRWVNSSALQCRWLDRVPLGTPYDKIVERIRQIVHRHPVSEGPSTLVVDATGVGVPVMDYLRAGKLGVSICGVSITGGIEPSASGSISHVPKTSLLSNLQLMFQNRMLSVANELPLAGNLRDELLEMRAEGHPGDLAMALALAAWQARTNFRVP